MSQTPRAYQTEALDRLRAGIRCGVKRQLLVAPTGSGKTSVAGWMIEGARAKGGAVLFLAHRRELIDQCSARLDSIGIDHGVIAAGHPRAMPGLPVQVASVQTLVRREKPRATLVIVDEAHHARANTYERILGEYPQVPVIGLSATPWRGDGRGLGELFQEVVVAARPRELIEQGHLVGYTGFAYDTPELAQVRKTGADYNEQALALIMDGSKLAGNIVEQWVAHAQGKRTVVFAVSIAHSQHLVERFRAAGVAAEHVDGEMHQADRASILARLASGETTVVSNCNVLTEGWDCPSVEVCVLARPTLSVGLYLQMVGRVLRPASGKYLARIHDHSGCILTHGAPDLDRDYSLNGDRPMPPKLGTLRTCPDCFALYSGTACPSCPHRDPEPVMPRELPQEITSQVRAIPLEEMRGQLELPDSAKNSYLEVQLKIAKEKGYKPSWAAHRYHAKFGTWPAMRLA
jgi:superfamily II DNA or RNA helicase